jgi:ribosomal protein S18 acetylase RimI-like enzyme
MSSPAAEIRRGTPADIDAVLAVWRAGRSAAAATPDTPAGLAALLARDPDALLVAEAPGEGVVGALIAGFDGWRATMYRLAVTPPQRRQRIGSALVAAGHERLAALGAVRVSALVGDEHAALSFWRAAGYARDDVHRLVRDL